MRRLLWLLALLSFGACVSEKTPHYRILVSTDIGGTDPDDNQSMTHLLMYANEFDIEGIVSSPSFGEGSKEEILRMIDLYEQDLPKLQKGLRRTYGKSRGRYPVPDELRAITKQGRKGVAPLCGYDTPTEGSEWIVACARKNDDRPLWILVWGALEDVAQALHDAPEIADRIRIYWIGGPNKKWGCNAYNYIAENFPDLRFIENNASYRGFIGAAKKMTPYEGEYWERFMKGAGVMGDDFIHYYNGLAKMGDTPSLLYLMHGDPDDPRTDHWGGRFEPMAQSPKYIVRGALCRTDTVPVYSLMEWRLQGPGLDIPADSVCFTLHVDKQEWPGYFVGDGTYVVRYAPKAPAALAYSIRSSITGFPVHEGIFTVGAKWPAVGLYDATSEAIEAAPMDLGTFWYTDCQDYTGPWQGMATVARWRDTVMKDWSVRFGWLK